MSNCDSTAAPDAKNCLAPIGRGGDDLVLVEIQTRLEDCVWWSMPSCDSSGRHGIAGSSGKMPALEDCAAAPSRQPRSNGAGRGSCAAIVAVSQGWC